jgi:nucleotide-binding universal stress UspA family protein
MKNNPSVFNAVEEFRAARLRSSMEQIRAALRGKTVDLLSYDEVREKIHAQETNQRELKNIPLNAIVGSVGRYTDFTRSFFPRQEVDQERWARVRMQVEHLVGLPPIEVYQVGEAYFVIDGNHRVSVANSLNAGTIEAYVTKVNASVPLSPDVDADELIIAERYANFLEATRLAETFPDIDLRMTAAGNYRVLHDRILAHQKWMGAGVSYQDAAVSWYKLVYKGVVKIIRQRGMLRDFPNRTETDLYVWIMLHRQELADNMGWALDHDMAARALVDMFSPKPAKVLKRAAQKFLDAFTFNTLESGPMTGEWRKTLEETRRGNQMFRRVLVSISGQEKHRAALEVALAITQREKGRIFGVHVCKNEAGLQSAETRRIETEFNRYCGRGDHNAGLRFETGNIARAICDSARWMDLVVVSLAHPPGTKPMDRLTSGFSQLIRRSPCPVLAVPQGAGMFERALLAYNDSPASREALFIAAYFAKEWGLPLSVISVKTGKDSSPGVAPARLYLTNRNIEAEYIEKPGNAASEILQAAGKHKNDLIVMGSYGRHPTLAVPFGSVVDEILRAFRNSVLVCR